MASVFSNVGLTAAGTLSFTQASYAFRKASHSGTPVVTLAVVVVVAAGEAAGGAVFVGAALRLVVEVGSDFAQLMSSRLETTKKAMSIDFDR